MEHVVVVQTNDTIEAWEIDLVGLTAVQTWSVATNSGDQGSPTYGSVAPGGEVYVFCQDRTTIRAIRPFDVEQGQARVAWSAAISPASNINYMTPGLGPVPAENPSYSGNLLYVATRAGDTGPVGDFYVLFADGVDRNNTGSAVAWRECLDVGPGQLTSGTFASPNVLDTGKTIVGAEDTAFYGFDNASFRDDGNYYRWDNSDHETYRRFGASISWTCGAAPGGYVLMLTEDQGLYNDLWLLRDVGTTFNRLGSLQIANQTAGTAFAWYRGAPALDSTSRGYVATSGILGSRDGRKVLAVSYTSTNIGRAWGGEEFAYQPRVLPCDAPWHDLRRQFRAPVAIDADGTLIVTCDGYILALRPMLGDFNGDGCRDNGDIDAWALALVDKEAWDTAYGGPTGINLLGVGDCNNDGIFDNGDIDCFVTLLLEHSTCTAFNCPCEGEGMSAPQGAPQDWNHLLATAEWLRAHFGME